MKIQVDADAKKIAEDHYSAEDHVCVNYTTLIRHLVGKCTSDIEKARAIFRYVEMTKHLVIIPTN